MASPRSDREAMRPLLELAEWLCGESARQSIFEPLIADWQRELADAQRRGRRPVAACVASGGAAFARSLANCAMTGDWVPTSRAAQNAILAFWLAAELAAAVVLVLALESGRSVDVRSTQTLAMMLYVAPVIAASSLLPALFVLRRDQRSTAGHAIAAILFGASVTGGVITLTTSEAISGYFTTFDAFEREYQRQLANDRAGRVEYPGTALRQQRGPTTIEQRRESYERFMAWRAEQEAKQQPAAPLTWRQHAQRYQPVALAVLLGMIGWTLAGLGAPSLMRAAMWWALMYAALLAFGGTPTIVGLPSPVSVQNWLALPFFGSIALALVIAGWRRHST